VHRTWVYAASGTGFRRILNYLSFTITSLIGLALTASPDVVFVESPPLFLSIPGWIAARVRGASMVFNVADLWPDSVRELGVMSDGWMLRFAERLEAWSYRRADIVNAVTAGIDRTLREKKSVPALKVRFFPNGIDVTTFFPREPDQRLLRQLRLEGRPVFLYAGTHGIAQGLQNVIEAAKIVEGDANVLFVGSGPTKAMLMDKAKRIGASNVRFLDPVPLSVMPDYFALATASIVPLVRGDLMRGARPSKIFPSLACAVPVIYSGEGESAELLTEAGAGIAVPPEDPRAIAGAMLALINDLTLRETMALNARRLAVERFAWSSIVGTWLCSIDVDPHTVVA
jgi:glycosyltransferase involved in cell wall biosynthesis